MKEPIKKIITDHFDSIGLTPTQLSVLKRLQTDKTPLSKRQWQLIAGLIVTSALIAVLIYVPIPIGTDLTFENIAAEMSRDNNKNIDLEFQIPEFEQIRSAMASKLGFDLVSTPLLSSVEWQLVGSRYSSIRKKIAAELHYRNFRTNSRYTLYQVPYPVGLKAESFVGDSKGNTVKIWKENGLLLGLVGPE